MKLLIKASVLHKSNQSFSMFKSHLNNVVVIEHFHTIRETQMTIDIVAMLVSQTKEIIKILLLRVHQHGCYDVR